MIQAATGVAALTGDPAGPPTLSGYSSADNSAGLTAALGLLAQIVSGRGGQVDVSLRDVVLSQLNYRASAYLNEGTEPRRLPFGAHSSSGQSSMAVAVDSWATPAVRSRMYGGAVASHWPRGGLLPQPALPPTALDRGPTASLKTADTDGAWPVSPRRSA